LTFNKHHISIMTPDIEKIRAEFPILSQKIYNRPLVYLDNTATSQTPKTVVDELDSMYFTHHANVHRGVHFLSLDATQMLEATRLRVARHINAPSDSQVIFTRGTTEAINLVAASYSQLLEKGDEIILTVMEHHSNIVPWQLAAQRLGLVIRVVPIDEQGVLDIDTYRNLLNERTRIVAFCHVSNVLGTVNPVKQMVRMAHDAGAIAVVDGAQASPHYAIDVQDLDVDFYAFSAHKMYGPTGVGVLYGRRELLEKMPPYQGGGEMIAHVSFDGTTFAELPFKFEAGTPDFTAIAAFNRTFDFIDAIGLDNIAAHEHQLLEYATKQLLEQIPDIRIFGTAPDKCALISFLVGNAHHYDTGTLLDRLGIAVRTGHHCAQPLMQALGIEGTVRASFAIYNTFEEVDAFVAALKRVAAMLS
jgi:cysteine desulfurase/selenocysteine lyase